MAVSISLYWNNTNLFAAPLQYRNEPYSHQSNAWYYYFVFYSEGKAPSSFTLIPWGFLLPPVLGPLPPAPRPPFPPRPRPRPSRRSPRPPPRPRPPRPPSLLGLPTRKPTSTDFFSTSFFFLSFFFLPPPMTMKASSSPLAATAFPSNSFLTSRKAASSFLPLLAMYSARVMVLSSTSGLASSAGTSGFSLPSVAGATSSFSLMRPSAFLASSFAFPQFLAPPPPFLISFPRPVPLRRS
mmetsp:Transcript_16248/g.37422  ORF Transcript_16248/g.37422 Transcript_16248/m.37422 type:complete len:239 (-) Transcript_16248:374-1090(-)